MSEASSEAQAASFEELYEHAPSGYLITTPDGIVTRANQTFLKRTGFRADEVLGTSFGDLCDVGSRIFYETRYQNVLRLRGRALEVALTLRCADGTRLPVLVNAVVAEAGASVRVAVFEATERQDYERELLNARRLAEASETRVRVLQDASGAFGATDSEDALAEALVASARRAFSATSAAVLLLDEKGELQLAAGVNPLDGVAMGERPEPQALASGQVVAIELAQDADAFPDATAPLRDARIESLTATPLLGASGPIGALVCVFGRRQEFDAHAIELHEALARLAVQVLERLRLKRQLEHNAQHDQLTGLANRQLLRERLSHAILSSNERGTPIAMIFLDLDGFKAVNDQLGHAVGDSVLREVAQRLRTGVRQCDVIGRFGGDEFIILCEDADADDAAQIAERVRVGIRAPFTGVPDEHSVTASIGVALYHPSTGSAVTNDELFRMADNAMYRSKNLGKDRVTIARE